MAAGDIGAILDEYTDDVSTLGGWHSPSIVKISDSLFCILRRNYYATWGYDSAELITFSVATDGTITAPLDREYVAKAYEAAEGTNGSMSLDIEYMGSGLVVVSSIQLVGGVVDAVLTTASISDVGIIAIIDTDTFHVSNQSRSAASVTKLTSEYVAVGFSSLSDDRRIYTYNVTGGSITFVDSYDFADSLSAVGTHYLARISGTNILVSLNSGSKVTAVAVTDVGVITEAKIGEETEAFVFSKPQEITPSIICGCNCGASGIVKTLAVSSAGAVDADPTDSLTLISQTTPSGEIASLGGTLYAAALGASYPADNAGVYTFTIDTDGLITLVDSIASGGIFIESYQSDIIRASNGVMVVVGRKDASPYYLTITTISFERAVSIIDDRVTGLTVRHGPGYFDDELHLGGLSTSWRLVDLQRIPTPAVPSMAAEATKAAQQGSAVFWFGADLYDPEGFWFMIINGEMVKTTAPDWAFDLGQ